MSISTVSTDAGPEHETGSISWLIQKILRDREGLLETIFSGEQSRRLPTLLLLINIALPAAYGAIMGMPSGWAQGLSSAVKLPMLYLLSLMVCFPILYIVNVLMGSRLGLGQTMAMILSALCLNSLLLVACAPVVMFFMLTGADYHFLKLMHVAVLGFAGLWAMGGLYRGLVSMCDHSAVYPRLAARILLIWMVVFGFVGTQMAWTLRPYLGAPDLKFELLRRHGSGNFYQAIWQSIENL